MFLLYSGLSFEFPVLIILLTKIGILIMNFFQKIENFFLLEF